MKFLSVLSLLPAALLAAYRIPANSARARLNAGKLARNGALGQGTGHARVSLGALTSQVDEATLYSGSGEVLRGHVQVTLPARGPQRVPIPLRRPAADQTRRDCKPIRATSD